MKRKAIPTILLLFFLSLFTAFGQEVTVSDARFCKGDDPAFNAQARASIEEAFPACIGKKIILYAPTFRGRVKSASTPGYFNTFDMRMIQKALGDEYVIVTKVHPYIKAGKKQFIPSALQNTYAYDATSRFTIDELLSVADVCISDYSSLIFEYSLFERPMLFYAYDLDDYNDWRGFYYDYHDLTPGPVCRDMGELVDELVHLDERFDRE
jgi:CDP-glycerol glycerophosphotransferase (TagB/SpsB family)